MTILNNVIINHYHQVASASLFNILFTVSFLFLCTEFTTVLPLWKLRTPTPASRNSHIQYFSLFVASLHAAEFI